MVRGAHKGSEDLVAPGIAVPTPAGAAHNPKAKVRERKGLQMVAVNYCSLVEAEFVADQVGECGEQHSGVQRWIQKPYCDRSRAAHGDPKVAP